MSFQSTPVREVMNPAPTTIHAHALLVEAANRMLDEDLSCLIVDPGDPAQGWGILTQKDLLMVLADTDATLEVLRVADVMTHPSVTVPPHHDVGTCLRTMRMLGVRRAAVVEGTELVGFVGFADLFAHAMQAARRAA